MPSSTLLRTPLLSMVPDAVQGDSATFSVTGGNTIERLRRGEMVPWAGFIAVEEVDTGDMRRVSEGALSWDDALLPIPLMAQFVNPVGGSGHDGAVLAGKITTLTRMGRKVWATGYIDPFAPGGINLALALDRQTMRGISVDLDAVELAESRTKLGTMRNIGKGRIRGATVCPFQAIIEATIELTTDDQEGAMAASAAGTLTARVFTPADDVESLVASGGSSIPLAPPKSWFEKPSNPADMNHPLEISADGRLSGIIASEGTCHIAFAGKCVPPPKSRTNYAAFRTGSVLTAEGATVRTGPIIMDTVHPDLRRQASDAMAFYAHTGCALADVVPYDTQFGIYVAGVMRPQATPVQIRNLRASDISPDWRFINGNPRECCALLAVNNGGFKVTQALAASAGDYVMPGDAAVALTADDEIFALVASGGVRRDGLVELAAEECGCGGGCCSDELAFKPFEKGHGKKKNPKPKPFADDSDEDEDDDEKKVELSAKFIERFGVVKHGEFMERFGPRKFQTPKVRVFRVEGFEQFHGNHDQSTHGNRAGRRGAFDRNARDSSGSNSPGATGGPVRGNYWDHVNATEGTNRSGVEASTPKRKTTGTPRKGGTLSNGEKVAPLGTPNATKSGYDPEKGMQVDEKGIPIVNWKTTKHRLEKDSWNLVRTDQSDLTDDNVYGPGKTYAPDPPSPPKWVYVGPDGWDYYADKEKARPADLKEFEP